ncbi:MAG: diaminopimelate epimerase [Calditrichia bacterium]
MAKEVPFSKIHGAGNDFILIDNRPLFLEESDYPLIRHLCCRRLGIGADGLMLLYPASETELHLKYYNADGHPAEMCGNGARCAVAFMNRLFPQQKQFSLFINQNTYRGEMLPDGSARIYWPQAPRLVDVPGLAEEIPDDFSRHMFVNSGVPHLILQPRKSLDKINVLKWGSHYRRHPLFRPGGSNVNFIAEEKGNWRLRTYERGVESETLACGTGALAVAFALQKWKLQKLPVKLQARGGALSVGCTNSKWWLEGPVQFVFHGTVLI